MLHFLNSKLGLLLTAFLLTTVSGALLSALLKSAFWQRQTRVDLFRKRYEEGARFLDSFSKSVGARFFALQRFLWAVRDVNDERLREIEAYYFKTVVRWNSTYWMNRNKIRLLVGDDHANAFLDYRDDFRLENPESLHYQFVKAHRYVLRARRNEITVDDAQKVVDDLNWVCSGLLETITTEFLRKATSLELLEVPPADASTLSKAIQERSREPKPPRLWD